MMYSHCVRMNQPGRDLFSLQHSSLCAWEMSHFACFHLHKHSLIEKGLKVLSTLSTSGIPVLHCAYTVRIHLSFPEIY